MASAVGHRRRQSESQPRGAHHGASYPLCVTRIHNIAATTLSTESAACLGGQWTTPITTEANYPDKTSKPPELCDNVKNKLFETPLRQARTAPTPHG